MDLTDELTNSAKPDSSLLTAEALEAPAVERSAAGASPKLGEQHRYENGAAIIYVEMEGSGTRKWGVFDRNAVHHSYRLEKEDAEKLAKALPG